MSLCFPRFRSSRLSHTASTDPIPDTEVEPIKPSTSEIQQQESPPSPSNTLNSTVTNHSLSLEEDKKSIQQSFKNQLIPPKSMQNMFNKDLADDRDTPQLPSTDGLDYPRAASWSSCTVTEIMKDKIAKQIFRCFLHESLAEENILFIDDMENIKKLNGDELKNAVQDLLDKYDHYVNISSAAKAKLVEISTGKDMDKKNLDLAYKEVYKLLENDQFPRFRRSELYLNFLEELLPRTYAEKWQTNFDALIGNQVGRWHFRQFLFSIHAEENLRFWEAIIEFKYTKNKSHAMLNMARSIHDQFLKDGCSNEVFLPFGLRQNLIKRIKDKEVDITLFDEASKHVEQVLKNDPYVRYLNSNNYKELLQKLH